MANLFLAHPLAFLLCTTVLAMLVKSLGTIALSALVNYAADRSSERRALNAIHARIARSAFDLCAQEDRERIATTLLASWTRPSFNANGEKVAETVEPVLVADAYRSADLILSMRDKTPLEIIGAFDPGPMPTFSEIAAASGAAKPYPTAEAAGN